MYHIVGLFIFILLISSVFYDKLKNSKFLLFYMILVLFIIVSIRYNIGTDYPHYNEFFKKVRPFTLHPNYSTGNEYFEPLFQYVVAILKYLVTSPVFYFSFWGFITLIFTWKGIKEQSPNYLLSIFIFYCIFYHHYLFNTIRQGVAMGIFLFSIKYILDRKFIRVLIISIFSSLFHSSGILIIGAYFMSMIKFKNRITLIFLLVSSLFIWKFGIGEKIFIMFVQQFQEYLPNLVGYFRLFLLPHTFIQVLQRVLVIIPLIYFYPNLSKDDRFSHLFSIYVWGTIIYFSFGFFSLFITRINMFFRILEIILIPILYEKVKNKNQKIIVQFVIMAWGFTVLTWLYYKEAYYPFKTIFGNLL